VRLGYLLKPENVRTTLRSILKYNLKEDVHDHFNCMRSFAWFRIRPADGRIPERPAGESFPYFTEAMTGFEYAAAVGMLYESMPEEGLRCIRYIRQRYDGSKRSPFDEAGVRPPLSRPCQLGRDPRPDGFRYSA